MNNNNIKRYERREFIKVLSVAAASCTSTCLYACSESTSSPVTLTGKKIEVRLEDNPTLLTVGGSVRKTFSEVNNGRPVLIVRTSQTSFRTMTMICTHQGSTINNPTNNVNKVICPNHGAQFSIADGNFGKNIGGQSTADLQTFETTFNPTNSTIIIEF
ncbi:MAG TPA: Rieske 2Fe-2S domain-containing protein [Candidatus Kapabacteria bacterium]|nr:Rieske 2Fe-2S domain-containing protein [Candidatus Kapabacteria bacterium]